MYPTERRSFQSNLKLSTNIRPLVADSYSPGAKGARRSAEDETVTNFLRRLFLKAVNHVQRILETLSIRNAHRFRSHCGYRQLRSFLNPLMYFGTLHPPHYCPFYTKVASAGWPSNSSSRYPLPYLSLLQNRARHSTIRVGRFPS